MRMTSAATVPKILSKSIPNIVCLCLVVLCMGARCSHDPISIDAVEEPASEFEPEVSSKASSGGPAEVGPGDAADPESFDAMEADKSYDDGDLPLQQGADEKL